MGLNILQFKQQSYHGDDLQFLAQIAYTWGILVTGGVVQRRSNSAGALAMIALLNPSSNYELCPRMMSIGEKSK